MGNDKKKSSKVQKEALEAAKVFVSEASLKNDPFGSYTGQPKEVGEKPVQDADDL